MKIAIFAHYDRDNIIDDYVINYLSELKTICDKVVFVSDSDLLPEEIAKVRFCDFIIRGRHGEYDFGSYKRGFLAIKHELENCDQLIFCNDSCYLIGNLKPVLDNVKTQVYGLVMNRSGYPAHLQSYFLVFAKEVFSSKKFHDFMRSITKLPKALIVEKYEVGLTQILKENFSVSSFIKQEFRVNPTLDETYFTKLRTAGFPLLKTDLLKNNSLNIAHLIRWKEGLNAKTIEIIENHVTRMIGDYRNHWFLSNFIAFVSRKPETVLRKVLTFFFSLRLKKGSWRLKILGIPVARIK